MKVDIAYGGSCTGGKREDLARCHEVLAWAAARGLKVAAGTRLILQFGSQDVSEHCLREGWMETFPVSTERNFALALRALLNY